MADLGSLAPALQPWANWIYEVGKFNDGRLVVTSAYRSYADQARLYEKWRRGETKLPVAWPGTSLHQKRWAFDMARIGVDPHEDDLLTWLGAIWDYVGGKHGGHLDPVHFQGPT